MTPDSAVVALWDETKPAIAKAGRRRGLRATLRRLFHRANPSLLKGIEEAVDDLEDDEIRGWPADYLQDRHKLPSRREMPTGRPYGANGEDAFEMADEFSNDDQHDNVAAEYSEFSRRLDDQAESLKALQDGQSAMAAALWRLMKGDAADDAEDAEDEPTAAELEKAITHLRNGGALPDGIKMASMSVQQVIERVMGQSKNPGGPPNMQKARSAALDVRLAKAIETSEETGALTAGDAIAAESLVDQLREVARGTMHESYFSARLSNASPAVRSLFAGQGVQLNSTHHALSIR